MSISYYIKLDRHVNFDPFVNGKNIARFAEKITEFCYTHGLKNIESFINLSLDSLAEFFDDFSDTDEQIHDVPWFNPEEGVVWAYLLIEKLQNEPADFDTVSIVKELHEYIHVLNLADKEGAKWHLAIDYQS